MMVKIGPWVSTVALILAAGWSGNCFAGSGLGGAPKEEMATAIAATPSESAGAGAVSEATEVADVKLDAAGGNVQAEEAEPAPVPAPSERRPGQPNISKFGIGLKISTLGVGVEAAVPIMARLNVRDPLRRAVEFPVRGSAPRLVPFRRFSCEPRRVVLQRQPTDGKRFGAGRTEFYAERHGIPKRHERAGHGHGETRFREGVAIHYDGFRQPDSTQRKALQFFV